MQPLLFDSASPRFRRDASASLIAPGVGRFRDPAFAHLPEEPFPAYVTQPVSVATLPIGFRTRPAFATQGRRRVVRADVEPGTSLYGLGEHAGSLLRNGARRTCWTTDAFEYTDRTPALYQAHPWVLGVRRDGTASGVLVETTWRCEVDLRRGIVFRHEGPSAPAVVIEGDSADAVVRALAELTGRIPLPPRWALGYHQSRWSYEPASRVLALAREFRERSMPCDAIWLDIDYMIGFRCFTFDKGKFPDPAGLFAHLHAMGFRAVCMVDPGIKFDPGYRVYHEGHAGGHFIKDHAGHEFHGKVWPGPCAFPDFTRERTRRWWGGLYREFLAHGVDGVWNDMNEPAVFDAPGKTMPADNRHNADADLGGPGPHARYHNVYGLLMARATREGMEQARPDRRAFVLTRANFLGGQRYAATWTGDNMSDWRHLAWSIPMTLNLGLSGQPFSGPDIGGFSGNADADLFARWMGIGALLPFARGHSIKDSKDHEPWSFGPGCERACRLALERRYRLLPYLYTLFEESSRTGAPVVRPLFFAAPLEPALRAGDDAFLLGGDVLVRADVRAPGGVAPSPSPMPPGLWRAFEPASEDDPALPRLFVRAGAIVPLGPSIQHTHEPPADPLTLVVSLDADGFAAGALYEDAGDGPGYAAGEFRRTHFEARREHGRVVIRAISVEGAHAVPPRRVDVAVLGEGPGAGETGILRP